jgi:DNA polymerase/3'-5' exonuclease PolX
MGVCKIGSSARRIDIKIFPRNSFGFALLHFTGSRAHNVMLRVHAEERGYVLSEHGLKKVSTGKFEFDCPTEEDVFKAL